MELFLAAVVAVVAVSINTLGLDVVFCLVEAVAQGVAQGVVQVTLAYLYQVAMVVLLATLVVLDQNMTRGITQPVKVAKLVVAVALVRTMVEDSLLVAAVVVAVVFLAVLEVRAQSQDVMAQLAELVVRARERVVRQVVPVLPPLRLEPVAVAVLAQRAA
jgi:sugar phosphate permease